VECKNVTANFGIVFGSSQKNKWGMLVTGRGGRKEKKSKQNFYTT
jgi:hypothetical protein